MRASLGVLLLLLLPVAARGGERQHAVRAGESVSGISRAYYGTTDLAPSLLAYNERRTSVIHPGEVLRIPYCDVHRVRAGDSWSALVQRYMGSAVPWRSVAELNGLLAERPLQVGQEVLFPVVLEHRLRRGETLARLAERFYGDAERGRLLREFNQLDDPRRLEVGAVVRIPLATLRLRASTLETASTTRPLEERTDAPSASPLVVPTAAPSPAAVLVAPPERFRDELEEAARAYRLADYGRARSLLEELREPVVTEGTAAEHRDLWRLLSFVHVAFDRVEDACTAHGALRSLGGSGELDPDLVSPKIRTVLAACRPDDVTVAPP